MRLAGVVVLGAVLVLASGCARHRSRPVHASPARQEAGGATGTRDDLQRAQADRYRQRNDSVPEQPPDISKLVEPTPKVEARSLYGNRSPYTVMGQTYAVLPTARGYDERGIASYYGDKFHGYKTSSLEPYDMYAFSAASKTLPLPSYARVTNLENGKSVTVRVNDRGPFHPNRIIDLSYAAAVNIGIWPKGTGLVEVRGIDPAQGNAELPRPPAVSAGAPVGIYLQVGAFADAANAQRVAGRLQQAKLAPVQVTDVQVNGRQVRRVRVGPLRDVAEADAVSARIVAMGLPRPRVAVD
ncbi:MAG: septal ring lytic transglycosylase RlpA family protein [Rhodanobacter sp.]